MVEKLLSRREGNGLEADGPQEPRDGPADRHVVVDDVDDAVGRARGRTLTFLWHWYANYSVIAPLSDHHRPKVVLSVPPVVVESAYIMLAHVRA